MSFDFVRYLLWVLAGDGVAVGLCWLAWNQAKTRKPDFRMQFGIGDVWLLMIFLAPAMWVGAQLEGDLALLYMVLMLPHQMAGVFIFRMDSPRFPAPPKMPLWKSALLTLSGTILGWIMPSITLALALIAACALLLILISLPVSLPVTFGYWLWRANKTVRSKQVQDSPIESKSQP